MTDKPKALNSRTVVKLDEKLIEIKKTKKGLVATELKDDAVVEATLLEEGVDKLLQNDMNRLANEAYEEITRGFKSTLASNVLKIAGFENRWSNGWEIDHCNGRQSMMTSYLSSKVQAMITQELDTLLSQQELADILKDTKKNLLKEVRDMFKRELQSSMRTAVYEHAQTFLKETIKHHLAKNQKQLIKEASVKLFGTDPDNDSSYDDEG